MLIFEDKVDKVNKYDTLEETVHIWKKKKLSEICWAVKSLQLKLPRVNHFFKYLVNLKKDLTELASIINQKLSWVSLKKSS